MERRKDIFLVVADTLTAFHLPMYGYDRDTAPFLRELAEDNILFKDAYSTAPWTVSSHASMFSGEMPDVCGTHSESLNFTARSFVEDLSEEGYQTVGVSNNWIVAPVTNFDRGFDFFECTRQNIYFESKGLDAFKEVNKRERKEEYASKKEKYLDFFQESVRKKDFRSLFEAGKFMLEKGDRNFGRIMEDSGAEASNELAKRFIEKDSDEDLFLFMNYMEPHQPFVVPDGYESPFVDDISEAEKIYRDEIWEEDIVFGKEKPEEVVQIANDLYDTTIHYLDSKIRELYEMIKEKSDDFLFIFVGDHGEMLGEDNRWDHGYGIWEELIRVPAIVAGPDVEPEVIEGNFSLRKIKDIIEGEDPEDLTQEKIFAMYNGSSGFAEAFPEYFDGEPEDEEMKKYYYNKSNCVVTSEEIFVENTRIPNIVYDLQGDGYNDFKVTEEVHNSIKIRFGSGEDIEF